MKAKCLPVSERENILSPQQQRTCWKGHINIKLGMIFLQISCGRVIFQVLMNLNYNGWMLMRMRFQILLTGFKKTLFFPRVSKTR